METLNGTHTDSSPSSYKMDDVSPRQTDATDIEKGSTEAEEKSNPLYNIVKAYASFTTTPKKIPKWVSRVFLFNLAACYIGYFITVLVIGSSKEEDNYWCDGDGFLVVITGTAFLGIFYFKVIKSLWSPRLSKRAGQAMYTWKQIKLKRWFQPVAYCVPLLAFIIFLYFDTAEDRTRLVPAFGILVLLFVACLLSASPTHIQVHQVYWGIGLQVVLALLILRTDVGVGVFECAGSKFTTFLHFTDAGSAFAFGEIVTKMHTYVFSILTVVLFFGMAVSILYYYGILQWVILKLGWLLENTMGTTPCESMAAAANIFLGQSEAPLVIMPYVSQLTNSEIHAVLTGGFATVAGGVLSAYISFGIKASHLLSASIMSAPAALAMSKIFYPETSQSKTDLKHIVIHRGPEKHVLHAIMNGLSASLKLIGNITASLIAFMACATFLNAVFDWSCQRLNYEEGTCDVQGLLAFFLAPVAWLMGVPNADCYQVGYLLGTKIILTEFYSYQELGKMMDMGAVSDRAVVITTYALCGFSSLASLGCQLAALGSMAPSRKKDISGLVVRALIAGNFACYLTAAVAGVLSTDSSSPAFRSNTTMKFNL